MSERRYRHPQVNLRLPEELKEKITRLSESNGRSANAEMVEAINFWIEANQEILDNPDKYPMGEKMVISRQGIHEVTEGIKRAVIEALVKQYHLVPKDKKPT